MPVVLAAVKAVLQPLGDGATNYYHRRGSAGRGGDRIVDAQDLTAEVDQRAAAVAGIDGGIRLYEIGKYLGAVHKGSVQCADHALADGRAAGQVERVADSDDIFSHPNRSRTTRRRSPGAT